MSTVSINGLTYKTQTMPTRPAPASLEFNYVALVATNTNPFSAQEQTYQWVDGNGDPIGYIEVSVSIATMTNDDAQHWVEFIKALQGPVCVFTLPEAVCALYPNELKTSGSSSVPRYFRLKTNAVKWAVKPGAIYSGLTFECREVL